MYRPDMVAQTKIMVQGQPTENVYKTSSQPNAWTWWCMSAILARKKLFKED
jgi:hypothetical protein